jgi:hypothetical protein
MPQEEALMSIKRLQRAGACGSMVGWLASATEAVQVLFAWRVSRPPLRRDSFARIQDDANVPL